MRIQIRNRGLNHFLCLNIITTLKDLSFILFPLRLIQEEHLSSTGMLPLGGLPRNSFVKIFDRPDMSSAVYRGRKATQQTNKNHYCPILNTDGSNIGRGYIGPRTVRVIGVQRITGMYFIQISISIATP